ncbi:MAG: hypothetical protein E2O85_04385 [Bacteroidetes bacterium]|nr:MAG: hypothetical protein E2O85_04385 [Bacteroidota bacterium]
MPLFVLRMISRPKLTFFAALLGAVVLITGPGELQAQSRAGDDSGYPFSWSGVTTYMVVVNSDGTSDYQSFAELTARLNQSPFRGHGIEALVVSAAMTELSLASASAGESEGSEKCAIAGKELDVTIGGATGFKDLIAASHSLGMRVALFEGGENWCGAEDAIAFNALREQTGVDGIIVNLAASEAGNDMAALRKADTEDDRLWIGAVFEDAEQIDTFEGMLWVDAAMNKSWVLPRESDDLALRNQFSRSVEFAVNHPDVSNIGMMSGTESFTINDLNSLLLQPGVIALHDGQVASDPATMEHWRILGSFRDKHPAIGEGAHEDISNDPYMFYRGLRIGPDVDEVLVVLGASGKVRLKVSLVFDDDTILRDAYTGKIAMVSYGQILLPAHENGVMLLEEVK